MKVGDLVWSMSLSRNEQKTLGVVVEKRLAIIIALDYDDYNPYVIQLVACGRQGKTSRKYLEPTD